jgi:hypothetical protein
MDGLLLNHGSSLDEWHIGRWAGTLVRGWRRADEMIWYCLPAKKWLSA